MKINLQHLVASMSGQIVLDQKYPMFRELSKFTEIVEEAEVHPSTAVELKFHKACGISEVLATVDYFEELLGGWIIVQLPGVYISAEGGRKVYRNV